MNRPSRPTLADVAAEAGVSLKTASRALNGEYGVAPATSKRVHEAAARLGFRLNHLARALATNQSSATVGMAIPTVADPFFAALAARLEAMLAARGYLLITASHGDDMTRQRVVTRAFVERRVDAIVLVSAPGDSSYLHAELQHGLTLVAVDRPLRGVAVDTVTLDNEGAARAAVEELLGLGHRRIAVIGFNEQLWTFNERFAGYTHAMRAAGAAYDGAIVALDCGDSVEAERRVSAMLTSDDPPTAVFALHNRGGRAAVRAMLATGVRADLTVFDDVADPDLLVIPPITVVANEPGRFGAMAAELALERLDGYQGPARQMVLPPILQHPRALASAQAVPGGG